MPVRPSPHYNHHAPQSNQHAPLTTSFIFIKIIFSAESIVCLADTDIFSSSLKFIFNRDRNENRIWRKWYFYTPFFCLSSPSFSVALSYCISFTCIMFFFIFFIRLRVSTIYKFRLSSQHYISNFYKWLVFLFLTKIFSK